MIDAASPSSGSSSSAPDGVIDALSPREVQVLELICKGLSNREIADQLAVTVHAVKFHLGSIYRKLGVANRTRAATAYLEAQPSRAEPLPRAVS